MKNFIYLLLGCLMISGCATPKYNYQPHLTVINKPPLSTIVSTNIDEIMLQKGEALEYDAINLKNKVSTPILGAYTFFPGFYFKEGEDKTSEYFLPSGKQGSGRVEKHILADPFKIIKIAKDTGVFYAVTIYNIQSIVNNAIYERVLCHVTKQNTFQQALIYKGVKENKISLEYREFVDTFLRPAVKKKLEVDLPKSKKISYKGATIQVLETTNKDIIYKVLSNFNS